MLCRKRSPVVTLADLASVGEEEEEDAGLGERSNRVKRSCSTDRTAWCCVSPSGSDRAVCSSGNQCWSHSEWVCAYRA